MRKLITTLMMALIVSVTFAQISVSRKTLPNLDTVLMTATTVTTTTIKYDTLKCKCPIIVVKKPKYKASPTLYYKNVKNLVISGDSINGLGKGTVCIQLDGCTNAHITKCWLGNSTQDGVYASNCSGLVIDSCFITSVSNGVEVVKSVSVKVNNNQYLNMNGPFPAGCAVQYDQVSGGGCQINYNRVENIVGTAKHPQDQLSVYKSNGLKGDSIQVIGNWIRGGQVQNDSGGAAGIVLGDVGGSYQVARYNIVINGGFVGMQVQGGTNIKMDHNQIFSTSTPYSNCGLCYGNYSGAFSSNVNISYNAVKFYQASGKEMDAWVDPKAGYTPIGWSTNILGATLSPRILPTIIINK